MFGRWRSGRKQGLVGIESSVDGIAIAHVVRDGKHGVRLVHYDYLSSAAAGDGVAELLQDRIATLGLGGLPCNWVMPNTDYTLLLVEAPNVEAAELTAAMRWRVKDLINFPVEEATLDVFMLPEDGSRSGSKMAYVVVAQKACVHDLIQQVAATKLKLAFIDITELALRNLAELIVADKRGVALVRVRKGAGNIALVRQENLYLSRRFDLAYNAGLLDDLPADNLVLELQRSLDYYERQMGQMPPTQIFVCGENINSDKIDAAVGTNLSAKVSFLELAPLLAGANPADEGVLQLCLGAIGGALRLQAVA